MGRDIYLTAALLELCKTLIENNPEGPIFRNRYGKPWSRNAIRCRFRRIRTKLKMGKDVVAYTYRHTFATDALANDVPAASVAELMGHSDLTMLIKHYSKLSQKQDHLRRAVERATTPKAS